MKCNYFAWLLSAVAGFSFIMPGNGGLRDPTSTHDAHHKDLFCRILKLDVETNSTSIFTTSNKKPFVKLFKDNDDGEIYKCETDASQEPDGLNGMTYLINLPFKLRKDHPELDLGESFVRIPSGKAIRDKDGIPAYVAYVAEAADSITLEGHDYDHRALQRLRIKREGISTVLVLRVKANDSKPLVSRDDIAGNVFGLGPKATRFSVRSQYQSCSFGKFRIKPATGTNIINGVGELFIDTNVTGVDPFALENLLVQRTEQVFGRVSGNFDHVIYCLPPGTIYQLKQKNWLAYAYLNHWRSIFNDRFCASFTGVMHELGHNLYLRHSDEGGVPYQDGTCLMGYSIARSGGPAVCFNGNKYWFLGWSRDHRIEIGWEKPFAGFLYAFVDYKQLESGQNVLIKVGDVYIQYNRAKSFNFQTRERKDEVTLVYNPHHSFSSQLIEAIAPNKYRVPSRYEIRHWEQTGHSLIIEACAEHRGEIDFMQLSIHLDNGQQSSTCNTLVPSISPSMSPTAFPSSSPSYPCEDREGSFRLDDGGHFWTCKMLQRSTLMQEKVCRVGHVAYDICIDTCRKCIDHCFDSTSETFFVNQKVGKKDCKWLYNRPKWQNLLCRDDHEANRICGETCNTCEVGATASPSISPTPANPAKAYCEDSGTSTFLVDAVRGNQTCAWLRKAPAWTERLCTPEHDAWEICPELCGKCTDSCEDDPDAMFYVNRKQHFQNCEWLASRPAWWKHLCRKGRAAYAKCRETCNNCED